MPFSVLSWKRDNTKVRQKLACLWLSTKFQKCVPSCLPSPYLKAVDQISDHKRDSVWIIKRGSFFVELIRIINKSQIFASFTGTLCQTALPWQHMPAKDAKTWFLFCNAYGYEETLFFFDKWYELRKIINVTLWLSIARSGTIDSYWHSWQACLCGLPSFLNWSVLSSSMYTVQVYTCVRAL